MRSPRLLFVPPQHQLIFEIGFGRPRRTSCQFRVCACPSVSHTGRIPTAPTSLLGRFSLAPSICPGQKSRKQAPMGLPKWTTCHHHYRLSSIYSQTDLKFGVGLGRLGRTSFPFRVHPYPICQPIRAQSHLSHLSSQPCPQLMLSHHRPPPLYRHAPAPSPPHTALVPSSSTVPPLVIPLTQPHLELRRPPEMAEVTSSSSRPS
jgi:hypothetical protein